MSDNSHHSHNHGATRHNEEMIRECIQDEAAVVNVANALKQLGDPSRLRIFWYLCHEEECVINIADAMNMTSPAISHHLRLLKAAGLIVSKRSGKEMFYSASDSELAQALHLTIEQIASITCPGKH
ncbi:MAG: metalloregulator ArsR/SmtB family transcription factor [Lachnospiraceae bacterium]|nr:metalloregulator ArsR/SmtB family transcription factor [Lachnospiraceae bacterium]